MKPKFQLLLILILLSVLPMSSKGNDDLDKGAPDLSVLYDKKNADHIVLVGFKDKTINRIQSTATAYRKRGSYQSSTWSEQITSQIAKKYNLQKLTEWPMTEVGIHCVVYQISSSDSVADTLKNLAEDSRVDVAQQLKLFTTRTNQSDDPYLKLQSNLQAMQISQVHNKTTGKNITIAMIDTGVDMEHPDLVGQISQNENFAEDISKSFSNDKHGTAVAGIMVAKKDNGTGITGVAPDANLVAFKACWPDQADAIEAVCNSYTLALAVNAAIKSGAEILNMSLTGPEDALLALLLNKAMATGMIVVAADTGLDKANENFPASLNGVISVQSAKKAGSPHPNQSQALTAPGEKILTTLPHGTYDFISGSSIAAAEVSGIIALLLEIKPDLSVAETKSILQQSELSTNPETFTGIDANNAILALCELARCSGDVLSFALKSPLTVK